ncbi:hypothetical protein DQ04_04241000 [Trypanosoma grayi]|uniref:hypothetical protein n=1 Tax=Trypanosoma grayi TaxID=71804 RepID=UPI0004F48C2E|nr:hypothetical protein DQ04_04241000 [Trypanosoma grayi]KEG10054.1 hypothetical protein DQ04_04241000 [Trypanosoma grayi]
MRPSPVDTFLSLWLRVRSPADLPALLPCLAAEEERQHTAGLNSDVESICAAVRRRGVEWDLLHALFALQHTAAAVPVRALDLMVILLCWEAAALLSLRWFFAACTRQVEGLLERRLSADPTQGDEHYEAVVADVALALYGRDDAMLWRVDEVLGEVSLQRGEAVPFLQAVGVRLAGEPCDKAAANKAVTVVLPPGAAPVPTAADHKKSKKTKKKKKSKRKGSCTVM